MLYTILCADKKEGQAYLNATLLRFSAKTEKEAMTRAKQILKRKHYIIREISEECEPKILAKFLGLLEKLIKRCK